MNRESHADLACPSCSAPVKMDERSSTRTARLIYACRSCGKHYAEGESGRPLVEDRTLVDAGSRTVRMKAVRHPATPVGQKGPSAGLPEGMSLALEATGGPASGSVFRMEQCVVVIGREAGEVRIADPMISGRHASLEVHDQDTIILRDLSSTNGTYHNDQLIAFCKLQDGDEIRLGSTVLTVSIDVME